MSYFHWSKGNEKVQKLANAVSFGIPAFESEDGFKTCPMAGACAAVCYARQGRYAMPEARATRERNLAIVRSSLELFPRRAIQDLNAIKGLQLVRVHDSGDFFSQEYLDAWYAIARALPHVRFYAYTKSLHLELYSRKPRNFAIVQSAGGKIEPDPSKSHSRIFASESARKRAGYLPGNATDKNAIAEKQRIGLVYHGSRSLTAAQATYFQ